MSAPDDLLMAITTAIRAGKHKVIYAGLLKLLVLARGRMGAEDWDDVCAQVVEEMETQ